jgi:hypothetical protein
MGRHKATVAGEVSVSTLPSGREYEQKALAAVEEGTINCEQWARDFVLSEARGAIQRASDRAFFTTLARK